MFLSESIQNKWQPVLDHPDLPEVKDSYKRAVTSMVLENQEKSLKEDAAFLSEACLLYTSPSPRDVEESRMPSSA